ncbi:L,D-transpeptidase family protein [Novosphingobium sp. G106]|nr:L,D-transpeptidase family protein [Novosphingobium sp. G106]
MAVQAPNMAQGIEVELRKALIMAGIAVLAVQPALAAQPRGNAAPEDLLPPPATTPAAKPPLVIPKAPAAAGAPAVAVPEVQPLPVAEPIMPWTVGDAQALLGVIGSIDSEGLFSKDYQPTALAAAIAGGPGATLDEVASKSFSWLAEDLRDGRTPMKDRVQWFAVDPDQDVNPTGALMTKALQTHDVAGVLASLAPTHPDYQALKATLAATPKSDVATRSKIRINMDRWRWLRQDLGSVYLLTNVPEFQLRLTVNNRIIKTYKTVVGKPGKTATPQLAEQVTAVVFNPTWTVPQSIVVGEGLGASLMRAPRKGYKATRGPDGTITVVQQPGPSNSLGLMKIDMPNPHAIYLHDTPAKQYFNQAVRAESHGCIRTERAVELGMTMAILGADMPQEQLVANATSGKYTRVPMTRTFPVYLTYFTMAQDVSGKLSTFRDIYGRDTPVLASFAKPRELKTTQRISDEPVVQLDNPL